MTRGSIRDNVLCRRYPENGDFDVEYCCNEDYKPEQLERCAVYRLFADGMDYGCAVTGQPKMPPSPFGVPDDKGLEDSKHFLPVDVFLTMVGWDTEGELPTVVYSTNAFSATSIGCQVVVSAGTMDD